MDEAQDLSHAQLNTIFKWRKRNKIVCFNDTNQTLEDNNSKTGHIIDLCKQDDLLHVDLSGSYRCPKEVIEFANAVMGLKLVLTGGLTDKFQQRELKLHRRARSTGRRTPEFSAVV